MSVILGQAHIQVIADTGYMGPSEVALQHTASQEEN